MRRLSALIAFSLSSAAAAHAQGRPVDWPFYAGDAQRTGWEKSDSRITKENVKEFQLVLKRKLEKLKGPRSLTPPVVIGNLISYRGFKELAFVSGASDTLWSIDADMDRIFWEKHFETAGKSKAAGSPAMCAAAATATPALTPPVSFGGRGRGTPAAAAPTPPPNPARNFLSAGGFGAPRPAFALSGDGRLHVLNTSTGDDLVPALSFLPAGAKGSSLVLSEGVIYTTTNWGCGGAPNGVWAIDLNPAEPAVSKLVTNGGALPGLGGLAFGAGGMIYTQTSEGALDPASNKWANTLLELSPKDLEVRQYFTASGGLALTTPVVFAYKDRELIVSAGKDGRLYLLDAQALGGDDHRTPLSETAPVGSIWGGLASWQDTDGTRWVLAPVWGPVNSELKSLMTNGSAPNGSVVAFKLDESNGKLQLTPAWISRDMSSPEPPVITSGIVFALSAGEYAKDEHSNGSGHATLYALDAITGKEMYSSGNQATAPANLTGMTIANGRVFFTTNDGALYAFGIYLER
jgi:outer membrane protein assembly factor BamB